MGKRYRFGFKRLDVYVAAVEHFQWTCEAVTRMPKGPFKVIDQTIGASLSIMGNIGEAHGREARPGEIEQHYRYALGSTFECATHLDALSALGVIDDDGYNAEEDRLARIGMMLTRLMQKQRRRKRELKRLTRPPQEDAAPPREAADTPAPRQADAVSNPREARSAGRGAAAPIRIPAPPGARGSAATDGHSNPRPAGSARERSDRSGPNPEPARDIE